MALRTYTYIENIQTYYYIQHKRNFEGSNVEFSRCLCVENGRSACTTLCSGCSFELSLARGGGGTNAPAWQSAGKITKFSLTSRVRGLPEEARRSRWLAGKKGCCCWWRRRCWVRVCVRLPENATGACCAGKAAATAARAAVVNKLKRTSHRMLWRAAGWATEIHMSAMFVYARAL